MSYEQLPQGLRNCVIYCDPPYRNTTQYATQALNYEQFYQWCRYMSKYNTVLISEYNMPPDFECIWSKESMINFDNKRNVKKKCVEKLFKCKA